uniref:Calponin-homology (CH) domain-containing protein n=1 Tax=Arcella intermedia TaxID=1963864 RepID=A0A6B2KX77_9EUKA
MDKELQEKRIANYDLGQEQRAMEWISNVIKEPVTGDFWAAMKSGAVLCKLMNAISPGSIPTFSKNPKFWLEERDNINKYLNSCKNYGVPSQDLFSELDLSVGRKDLTPVLQNIYALARQAQAHGWSGPSLGVNYYKTVEEQKQLESKKRKEREEEMERVRQYEEDRKVRRVELEGEQSEISNSLRNMTERKGEKRRQDRMKLGKKLKPFQEKIKIKDQNDVLFGIDYEIEKKKLLQYDTDFANNIMDWIEDLTGEEIDYFYECLKSGRVLCNLINTIRPHTIDRINKPGHALAERENIQKFLKACVNFGVPNPDIFDVNDLYDNADLRNVMMCLFSLSRVLQNRAWYAGPLCRTAAVTQRAMTMAGKKRNISVKRVLQALDSKVAPERPAPEVVVKDSDYVELSEIEKSVTGKPLGESRGRTGDAAREGNKGALISSRAKSPIGEEVNRKGTKGALTGSRGKSPAGEGRGQLNQSKKVLVQSRAKSPGPEGAKGGALGRSRKGEETKIAVEGSKSPQGDGARSPRQSKGAKKGLVSSRPEAKEPLKIVTIAEEIETEQQTTQQTNEIQQEEHNEDVESDSIIENSDASEEEHDIEKEMRELGILIDGSHSTEPLIYPMLHREKNFWVRMEVDGWMAFAAYAAALFIIGGSNFGDGWMKHFFVYGMSVFRESCGGMGNYTTDCMEKSVHMMMIGGSAAEFFGMAMGGFLCGLLGPKVTASCGVFIKIIGCLLLALNLGDNGVIAGYMLYSIAPWMVFITTIEVISLYEHYGRQMILVAIFTAIFINGGIWRAFFLDQISFYYSYSTLFYIFIGTYAVLLVSIMLFWPSEKTEEFMTIEAEPWTLSLLINPNFIFIMFFFLIMILKTNFFLYTFPTQINPSSPFFFYAGFIFAGSVLLSVPIPMISNLRISSHISIIILISVLESVLGIIQYTQMSSLQSWEQDIFYAIRFGLIALDFNYFLTCFIVFICTLSFTFYEILIGTCAISGISTIIIAPLWGLILPMPGLALNIACLFAVLVFLMYPLSLVMLHQSRVVVKKPEEEPNSEEYL